MPSESIKCPSCSATEILLLQGNQYRCRYCATAFVFTPENQPAQPVVPPPRVFVPIPARQDNSVLIGLIVAGVVATLVFGGFFLFLARGSSGSANQPAKARVIPVQEAMKQQAGKASGGTEDQRPAAELQDIRYFESVKYPRWIGRYINTGNCRIFKPSVTISVYDDQGKRVGEATGMTRLTILEPGQEAVFDGTINQPPKFARYEIKPKSIEVGDPDLLWQADVSEANLVEGANGRKSIVGTIENRQKVRLGSVQVTVFGYDGDGKPVGVWSGVPSSRNLNPGEKAGFTCVLDLTQGTEMPASFRYIAGSMR